MLMGHEVGIVSGSLGARGVLSNAYSYYSDLLVFTADYDLGMAAYREGRNPQLVTPPFHASYEDRGDVPDRPFDSLTQQEIDHSLRYWKGRFLRIRDRFMPDLLHMHHLTTQVEAAREIFEGVPIVQHFHGTELKNLERGRQDAPWRRYAQQVAQLADRTLVLSTSDRVKATQLLGIPHRQIGVLPNGVDLQLFFPSERTQASLGSIMRRLLVQKTVETSPSGLDESPGYSEEQITLLVRAISARELPLVVFVGRFTAVKRLSLLMEAIHQMAALGEPVALLVVGGYPGEVEGEHPVSLVLRRQVENVYFAGWRSQHELAQLLSQADLLALPSSDESFGLVLLEALACGTPVLAADIGGPREVVRNDVGWLFEVDSVEDLMGALRQFRTECVRGLDVKRLAARDLVGKKYAWSQIARQVESVYDSVRLGR